MIAAVWPAITVIAFVVLVAIWALLTGALELMAAFRLEFIDGRGWLAFGGVISLIFGALLIIGPMSGAVAPTWWLGAYALIFGVSLIEFGFKLEARLDGP